jgi:endonuclease/exonuclease/phosphatase family metal-dependent hydrolase
MTTVLRVGTWNINEGIPPEGSDRDGYSSLTAIIARADLDVLALQEVPFDRDSRSAILGTIARQTKLRHASSFPLSPSILSPSNHSGVALVTKLPHSVSGRTRLPNPNLQSQQQDRSWVSWDKGMLAIELKLAGLSLCISSVHCYPFHKFGRRAEDQEFAPMWHALADAINHLPRGRMIVAGDFNTERRDLITGLVQRHHLVPAIEGVATHHGLAVDDILHDAYLIRQSFAVTPSPSDHAFCQAEFIIGDDVS